MRILIIFIVGIVIKVVSYILLSTISTDQEYPVCGDCWCIPDYYDIAYCPEWSPEANFNDSVISTYRSQVPTSIYTLDCNPYIDTSCKTIPELTYTDISTAVCGLLYNYSSVLNDSCSSATYEMISFESEYDALLLEATITHTGTFL